MYQQFFTGNPLLGFAIFGLLFFIAVFVAVVVMTLRAVPRDDARAQLPLSDDATPYTGAPHHV